MTVKKAQLAMVGLSLVSIAIVCLVFITGRLWHFPLDYAEQQDIPLAQMAVPPFFAVLGTAAGYLRSPSRTTIADDQKALFAVLIWTPGLLFLLLFGLVTAVFHYSNQPGSSAAFPLDSYRTWIMILLALISLTVPALSETVFKKSKAGA